MVFCNPMLVVTDMEQSVAFYKNILDLDVILDFGANKTLTGGMALQTLDSFKAFIGSEAISFGSKNAEMYFEEDDFDRFIEKLSASGVEYVHPVKEHSWGQRVVRFYDPDRHIIEVGESMSRVCRRFLDSGLSEEGIARRMGVSVEYVRSQLKKT